MPVPDKRTVLVAVDESEYSEKAFDCKYNLSIAVIAMAKCIPSKINVTVSPKDSGQFVDKKIPIYVYLLKKPRL